MFLDLLFPRRCLGCGVEGNYLCLPCQEKIRFPPQRCVVCGKPSFLGRVHQECRRKKIFLKGLLVAADYQNQSIQNLIWNFKYNSVSPLGEILATLLTDFFISLDLLDFFATSAVIPVPLHKRRLRERGFNQAQVLAQKFAHKTGLEFLEVLRKEKNTKDQIELSREERLRNVQDSFASLPHPSLGERKIILVDDVATTGATLNECAKVLRGQGAGEIWGLVVARN